MFIGAGRSGLEVPKFINPFDHRLPCCVLAMEKLDPAPWIRIVPLSPLHDILWFCRNKLLMKPQASISKFIRPITKKSLSQDKQARIIAAGMTTFGLYSNNVLWSGTDNQNRLSFPASLYIYPKTQ